MAEKRMFAKSIIDSDAFLDLPLSTQALYFHLCMRADDDGFVGNPKKIQRMIGATDGDGEMLISKRFIIAFQSGVIVIKHWKMQNYIPADRYKPTAYQEEISQLYLKKNKAYTDHPIEELPSVYDTNTECIQNVSDLDTQIRLDKISIDKIKLEESSVEEKTKRKRFVPPTVEEVSEYCKERGNNVDPERFVAFYSSKNWMVGRNKMVDWKQAVITWERKDKESGYANNNRTANKTSPGKDWGIHYTNE